MKEKENPTENESEWKLWTGPEEYGFISLMISGMACASVTEILLSFFFWYV